MSRKARVVVVGSINMDLVVVAPRIPLRGETITGSSFSSEPGGKGANQAVAASRLGADVHLVGCVGDDTFGRELLLRLKQEHIQTEFISTIQGVASGVAMITVSETGENSIVLSPGANGRMSPHHVREAEAVIGSADILLVQLEIPMDSVEEAVRLAKLYQVPVILNPAPARQLSTDLLQQIDILTPNETEGKLIVTGRAEGNDQVEDIIFSILSKGVKQVVMTLGSEGVAYSDSAAVRRLKAHKVEVVDTTGAGDSLNAGLGVYLAEGNSLEQALHFAQKVAALSVTGFGAQSSMPNRTKVEGFEENRTIGGE